MDSQRSGLTATDLSGPRFRRQGGLREVWSWGAFLLNKSRASPRGGPAGTGPWNKGRGLGLLRAGPPASLDGAERRDWTDQQNAVCVGVWEAPLPLALGSRSQGGVARCWRRSNKA